MSTINATGASTDRHNRSDRADPRDYPVRQDRTDRHDHTERTGIIGWQRSAWSSVLMAAVTAIALQLVFTVLGMAIGATATEAGAAASADAGAISMAAGAWWLVSGAVALMVGGLTLGRMSGIPRGADLVLAALTLWAVTAVFGFFVVWTGMMSAVSSPLTAMSASALDTAAVGQQGAASAEFANTTGAGAGAAEGAQDATRTASWWAVVGMLIGAAVTIGGAWMTAPNESILVGD